MQPRNRKNGQFMKKVQDIDTNKVLDIWLGNEEPKVKRDNFWYLQQCMDTWMKAMIIIFLLVATKYLMVRL